jgi:DNA helicase-2/ATP-dependent DNA helicase PcrA
MNHISSEQLLTNLNDLQKEAALLTEGPVLILAGAGSGKTRVITYRIGHILLTGKANPTEILALTFTNKAAKEMKERIGTLFEGEIRGLWLCTFHALGARLLRRHSEAIARSSSFTIYDDDDTKKLVKSIIKEYHPNSTRVTADGFRTWMGKRKFGLVNPELNTETHNETFMEQDYLRMFSAYQKHLLDNNSVDFDDLLTLPMRLFLDNPEILATYQERFKYILVDEYQDTNRAQYHLCRAIAGKNQRICVVGDEDQSIYSWRGADIRNILDFERDYPGAKVFNLVENYRSTASILKAAANLISTNSQRRKTKELWTKNGDGNPVNYTRYSDGKEEARTVVSTVEDLICSGYKKKEIAILYRIHAQSRAIETELVRRHIPYKIFGGTKFYERKETKDLLAFLRILANPLDDISLLRIINVPPRKIGQKTIERIKEAAESMDLPLYAFLEISEGEGIGKSSTVKLREFYALMEKWRENFEQLDSERELAELVRNFIAEIGYVEYLQESDKEDRVELVNEFLSATAEENPNEDDEAEDALPPLVKFLNKITLATDQDSSDAFGSQITLMTLHNAKGLEYPAVFLIGLDEGLLPHANSLESPDQIEEERRLCYVGFTRAEKRLYLSGAVNRFLWGRPVVSTESRFLKEAALTARKFTFTDNRKDNFSIEAKKSDFFDDEQFNDPFWDD